LSGELTALHRPPGWVLGRGVEGEKGGKGKWSGRKVWEGKGMRGKLKETKGWKGGRKGKGGWKGKGGIWCSCDFSVGKPLVFCCAQHVN